MGGTNFQLREHHKCLTSSWTHHMTSDCQGGRRHSVKCHFWSIKLMSTPNYSADSMKFNVCGYTYCHNMQVLSMIIVTGAVCNEAILSWPLSNMCCPCIVQWYLTLFHTQSRKYKGGTMVFHLHSIWRRGAGYRNTVFHRLFAHLTGIWYYFSVFSNVSQGRGDSLQPFRTFYTTALQHSSA